MHFSPNAIFFLTNQILRHPQTYQEIKETQRSATSSAIMCGDQVVMWRTGTAPHIGSRSTIGLWRWWKCTLIGKFESTLPTISVRWTWRQGRRWSLNTANACSWAVAWIPRRMWKWRCRSLKEDGENRGITTDWTSPLVVPTINKKPAFC